MIDETFGGTNLESIMFEEEKKTKKQNEDPNPLSDEQMVEALAIAAAARRAEERAEEREIQRALEKKRLLRMEMQQQEDERIKRSKILSTDTKSSSSLSLSPTVQYISRRVRQDLKESIPKDKETETPLLENVQEPNQTQKLPQHLSTAQLHAIKKSYLGESSIQQGEDEKRNKLIEKKRRDRQNKKTTFKFEWDASDDTAAGNDTWDDYNISFVPISTRQGYANGDTKVMTTTKSTSSQPPSSVFTKPLSEMTARDWRIYRESFDIIVRGGQCPPPLRSFTEAPHPSTGVPSIYPALLDAIVNVLKYREPSPIQRQAIPIGLKRRDLIGIAETGSGKTLAFGLPLCSYVLSLSPSIRTRERVAENGPLAMVLAPTRELALQIDAELNKLLKRQTEICTVPVVGGQSIQVQSTALRKGAHIIVGTPGRIIECIEIAYLVLNQCTYVVLDEADRMIDLGFAPQIEQILDSMGGLLKSDDENEAYQQEMEDLARLDAAKSDQAVDTIDGSIPRHRLTAMFSATMPPEVQRIAARYLRHPAVVSIGDQDGGKNERIKQRIIFLANSNQKQNTLREILLNQTAVYDKVIVFVNEKKHADEIGRTVERFGRRCVVLHGGKSQDQREENLELFRRGGFVLVATDVAARGIHIDDIRMVINFDMPNEIENYVHRIGRTGRAGKEGSAISFFVMEKNAYLANDLVEILRKTHQNIPHELQGDLTSFSSESGFKGKGGARW